MALPPPTAPRQRVHKRDISIQGYRRDDGRWDIEGHLVDIKDHDFNMTDGVRRAGDPVHEMWLRITIDAELNILDACAVTDAMPYRGACDRITPDYGKLKGMRIAPGFRDRLRETFGTLQGCTHLTELIGAMATGAVQALSGEVRRDPERKPRQLDGCHALDTRGPVVARFYSRWYTGKEPDSPGSNPGLSVKGPYENP